MSEVAVSDQHSAFSSEKGLRLNQGPGSTAQNRVALVEIGWGRPRSSVAGASVAGTRWKGHNPLLETLER